MQSLSNIPLCHILFQRKALSYPADNLLRVKPKFIIVKLDRPNDEVYNMKNEDEYIEGMIRLTEGHDDQLGIFTDSYEDEVTMLKFFKQMAA